MVLKEATFCCTKCNNNFTKYYGEDAETINFDYIECPFCNEEQDKHEDYVIEKQLIINEILEDE